jgi:hypothetical protein
VLVDGAVPITPGSPPDYAMRSAGLRLRRAGLPFCERGPKRRARWLRVRMLIGKCETGNNLWNGRISAL